MSHHHRKLLTQRLVHPRCGQGDNWGGRLRIGFLIDWLDSRPQEQQADTDALRWLADRDELARAAAMLSGRHRGPREMLMFTPHNEHNVEYSAGYHAAVVGHLDEDELADGEQVYRQLFAVAPDCLSAMANTAELEVRRGAPDRAVALLTSAVVRASASTASRHGVRDRTWRVHLRCALARLGVGDEPVARELLDLAAADALDALAARLQEFESQEDAAVPAHRAFADADRAQRIVLRAAMRAAAINPRPPPSAHASLQEIAAAEARLLQRHSPQRR